MQTTVDLRAITDRVLGLSLPRVAKPVRQRADRSLGLVLLLISVLSTLTSLGLWADGRGGWAGRVFCLTILLLALTLRLL